jgi:hypothetical protein
MNNKEIVEKAVEAVEESPEYSSFLATVGLAKTNNHSVNKKMETALSGVRLGLGLATVLNLLGVAEEDYKMWCDDPDNKAKLGSSLAMADVRLEAIVYQAAVYDPQLAMRLLEKRNPGRWQVKDSSPHKTANAGLGLSAMLNKRAKQG